MNFDPEATAQYLEDREADLTEAARNCKAALEIVVKALHELDPEHPKLQLLVKE
jgi:predicted RNase H-like HicB family nuclease